MAKEKQKKSVFDNPLLSTKVKSANAKLFPEALLGYLVGPTLALLANSILSAYLNKYMTDILDLQSWAPTFLTLLPIISVIFVVIGNILVGRLMDHNKTKAGKARPLILLSIPLSVIGLLVLFIFTPLTDAIEKNIWTLILLAVGYNLWFSIAYPFYYTSHAALVNLSTRSSKDRGLLATVSNATALAAMGLSSMILPFFIGLLFTGNPETSYNAWKIFAIALMAITAIGAIVEYYFTRERVTEESFALSDAERPSTEEEKKAPKLSEQVKICFKDKYWWLIIVFFFLYQLGGMMKNVSQNYFTQAWMTAQVTDGMFEALGNTANGSILDEIIQQGGNYQGTLSIIGAIPTALGMVLAWPLSQKIGKGKAILFGSILSGLGGILGMILVPNMYGNDAATFAVATTSFVIKALGSTPAMYLSMALMADVLDHQEALTGVRTDGFTMTIYGAIMAGMTGIATGIMNGMLGIAGYTSTNLASDPIRNMTLWIFIGAETIAYLGIAAAFIFMGVEKFSKLDHLAIIADQKTVAESKGETYIEPEERMKLEEAKGEADVKAQARAQYEAKLQKQGV